MAETSNLTGSATNYEVLGLRCETAIAGLPGLHSVSHLLNYHLRYTYVSSHFCSLTELLNMLSMIFLFSGTISFAGFHTSIVHPVMVPKSMSLYSFQNTPSLSSTLYSWVYPL